jgi:hypothetical protein
MATSNERLKILKMVQEKKISAEERIELLDLISEKNPKGNNPIPDSETQSRTPAQWFRVVVTDTLSGKTRVNVRLPVSLVNAGMKMGARFSPQIDGLDRKQLLDFLQSGTTGKVIDVLDDDGGEHVEVYIE